MSTNACARSSGAGASRRWVNPNASSDRHEYEFMQSFVGPRDGKCVGNMPVGADNYCAGTGLKYRVTAKVSNTDACSKYAGREIHVEQSKK